MAKLMEDMSAWYLCADGKFVQPLDIFYMFFPKKGWDAVGDNVCYAQKHYKSQVLRSILPNETDYFLPDDLIDTLVTLLILTAVVSIGFVLVKHTWNMFDPNFRSIRPSHKKWYVVANLFKAFILFTIAFSSRVWKGVYRSYFHDNFPGLELKRLSVLYIVTDVVALFMVPKLPMSTILHHIVTSNICILSSPVNISVKGWSDIVGVTKMGILYATCSCIPFLANAYLALRVVYPGRRWLKIMRHFSLLSYLICCSINWTIHAFWLLGVINGREMSVIVAVYATMLCFVVYDDIVLIKWLSRHSSPMASAEQKKKQ